jgi:glycosyltransferase involved in cell wall biosynthesis
MGFLHLGDPRGGIHRYGRILAEAMRSVADVEVIERSAQARDPGARGLRALARAAGEVGGADATVLQYSRHRLWANGPWRLLQLALVHAALRCRAVVVVHDVPRPGEAGRAEDWSLRLNLLLGRAVVVHGAHECARLARWPGGHRVLTLPHFIEPRVLPEREHARRRLGVEPDEVILAMLGWIHPRKNHAAVIEALALLDRPARLWLIGATPQRGDRYVDELLALGRRCGLEDRIEITGYVTEEQLDLRLAALDVALCPYTDASASGSLATLLGAGRPVVATDLPAFREQLSEVGGLLRLVREPTPERLAAAVDETLDDRPAFGARAGEAIAALAPGAVALRYLDAATRTAGVPQGASRRRGQDGRPAAGGSREGS